MKHPLFSCLLVKILCGGLKGAEKQKDTEAHIDEDPMNINLDIIFDFKNDEEAPPTYEEVMENNSSFQ